MMKPEKEQNPVESPPPPPPALVIDKTLSSSANLVKLLPSGTVLAYQALSPSFSNRGNCHASNKYLTAFLIGYCVLTCAFFSFTDSLTGRDGKLYYGVATIKGFYVLNYDGDEEGRGRVFRGDLQRYRLRALDCVHAFLAVMVFLTVAFSDTDVQECFFPAAEANTRQLLENLPLGVGFVASVVFMVFPTTRKGIGYSDMAAHHPN